MSAMEPQISFGTWVEVETDTGCTYWVEHDYGTTQPDPMAFDQYKPENVDGEPRFISFYNGYGARLSAPGYLDCTPWSVFRTVEAAAEYLLTEFYDDDYDTMDDEDQTWVDRLNEIKQTGRLI